MPEVHYQRLPEAERREAPDSRSIPLDSAR